VLLLLLLVVLPNDSLRRRADSVLLNDPGFKKRPRLGMVPSLMPPKLLLLPPAASGGLLPCMADSDEESRLPAFEVMCSPAAMPAALMIASEGASLLVDMGPKPWETLERKLDNLIF
jgi:hypothetical protein